MELNNVSSAREMFEQLSTEKLDELLDAELHRETPDENAIRMIFSILRERDKDRPREVTPQIQTAWEKYQDKMEDLDRKENRSRQIRNWVVRATSIAAVLVVLLMVVVPKQADAESFWEVLQRWTAEIVEFFSPADNEHRLAEYKFVTDNPGLQQVYDAVVELGVTDPVVPMWLPEVGEAIECKTVTTPVSTGIYAALPHGDGFVMYKLNIYNTEVAHTYHGDGTEIIEYIQDETTFNIMRNNEAWVVFWTKDNIECSIAVDCQEDDLYKILKSIYTMEDN